MTKLYRSSCSIFVSMVLLALASLSFAGDPMDEVFSLLDTGGGTRTGVNQLDGYYVVALGFSDRSSENKAYEEARIEALRQLTEMVNGVTMSGSTRSSMKYVTVSEGSNSNEFSESTFIDVVKLDFKGKLSAAKLLKKGQYDGEYFVAISISQTDVKNINSLKSHSGSNDIPSSNAKNEGIASYHNRSSSVEAKGLASMKNGEQQAREKALQDAIRNAVQQAQGVMLQGKSGMFNDALTMALSTKTEGYVSGYEILDEDIERGNYYIIMLAEVDSSKLLSDVNFYLNILGDPIFSVSSNNQSKSAWIKDELERLGFSLNDNKAKATHSFYLEESQNVVENHKGDTGIETLLSVTLKDNHTGNILFTITNEPIKTRIYVKPVSRARQVSEHISYKQMESKLANEVIQSLAKNAEKGVVYKIIIKNAKRTDIDIFKHVLNNGTSGSVESWAWNKNGKIMTLNYRFSGPLSEALDQGLDEIYSTFKLEGKGRRPHLESAGKYSVNFDMKNRQ